MPHDPVRVTDTRAWPDKAAMDLRSADVDLQAAPPILGDALFHCQQAIEKALKAFLSWRDIPVRKTHDLGELGAHCVEQDAALEPLLRQAAPLTEFAWKYRYPGDVEEPVHDEAVAALALARNVVSAISARVAPEARAGG